MRLNIGTRKIEDEEQLQADLGERFRLLSEFLTDFMITPEWCDKIVNILEERLKNVAPTKTAHVGFNDIHIDTDGKTAWVEREDAEPPDQTEELSYADFRKIFAAWRQALIDGKSGYTIEI